MKGVYTRIYLLRHGEVTNPRRVFYGQQDVPLSGVGMEQSRRAAGNLRDLNMSAVISSDLSRCRFLARAVAGFHDIEPEYTAELREVNFGAWTGLTREEIDEGYPGAFEQRMRNLADFRPPGGENLSDMQQRIWAGVQGVLQMWPGRNVTLVAHGGVNRVLLATVLGMSLDNVFVIDQGHTCTNILDFSQDGLAVVRALNLPHDLEQGIPRHFSSGVV